MSQAKNQNNGSNTSTTSRDTGCLTCMNLYDNRYCIKWRDVVPDEIQKDGCEEIDQFPPF